MISIHVRGLDGDHSKCAGKDTAPNVIDLDNMLGALKFDDDVFKFHYEVYAFLLD